MVSNKNPSNDEPIPWHCTASDDVLKRVASRESGLLTFDASQRMQRDGRNAIIEGKARSIPAMFFDQFKDAMIIVLLGAAVISGLIGDVVDTLVVIAILVLNAVIGFIQEYRAERAIAALKKMAALNARVLRDNVQRDIPATELVVGDVVLLEAGNVIPADMRLVESAQLQIEEAALTGESQSARKNSRILHDHDLPLGDRHNMVYKGTLVTSGRGRGIVVAIGMQTELGRIAALLSNEVDVKTPLQKRLARFGRGLAVVVLAICTILFVAGLLRGEPVLLMLMTAISLGVAAIPEALPAVVSVSLALGAQRMIKRQALIRKLPAVETLGSVTYICSDKTGTLTENRMRAEEIIVASGLTSWSDTARADSEPWSTLFRALALSNDVWRNEASIIGDPTEIALFEVAEQSGFNKIQLGNHHPRVAEVPFDSERARMTTLHQHQDEVVAYTKGAPESVLSRCTSALGPTGLIPIAPQQIEAEVERMARNGLRVLAIAVRKWPALPESMAHHEIEAELTLVGLVGLIDPPRESVQEAVALCKSAGITPVMITGDHPETAAAIALRLGILDQDGEVMTGRQLSHLSLQEFEEKINSVRVYARVTPEQKIKIVQALQDKGEFVAMTGDGVNDAPALKRADIGIAMGITGTDVAKEAAHMILLDDNFATIVSAVREGRRIFDNIRKFIKYTMTSNSGEIWTIFLAPLLGMPIPLLPIHILWINLVTDGLPGVALAMEPEEKGVMNRPPRPPNESIFAHGMWQHMLWVGLLMGALSLLTQAWAIKDGNAHWQTMVFTVLTLSQLGHVLAIRSETESLFAQGIFSNRPLIVAVLFTVALQMAVIYVPWMNVIFKTQPLSVEELAFCMVVASVVFFAVEVEKWLRRHGWLYREV